MAAILVALVPFIYFFPAVFGDLVLAPDDGLLFNVPLRATAANLLRSGSLPFWNPYIFSGMPLHASVQGGLLFPLNWWFLIFNSATAANLMVLTTYSLAGLGAYLYARKINTSIPGAILTGVAWQLGGCMVGQISHINIAQTSAMLPWVLWTIDGYGASGKRKWGVGVAVTVCLQAFVGHPQTLVYALLLIVAYAIAMGFTNSELRARYFKSLALVVAGLLLASVQILPTLELLRNSIRSDSSYEFFSSFSLPVRSVLMFFAPYILGGGDGRLFRAPYIGPPYYPEFVPYLGVVTLILVIVALMFRPDWRSRFWFGAAIVAFVLALGDNVPFGINRLIYHVPLLNLFRVPARHLMEVDFALAVLAGRGLTVLGTVELSRKKQLTVGAICLGVFVLTCLIVTVGRPTNFRLGRDAAVSILRAPELFLPIVITAVSAFAIWRFAKRRSTVTVVVVLLIAIFDLGVWGQFSGWIQSPRRSNELWGTPESVKKLREITGGDITSYRILTAPHHFDPNVPPIPPSVSHSPRWSLWSQPDPYMMHGIRNAGGYDGFGLQRYGCLAGDMKVWGELTDPNTTLRGTSREIDILNVRYLVSLRDEPVLEAKPLDKATFQYGPAMFAPADFGLPNLKSGTTLRFKVANVEADSVALVTNLSWSIQLPDGATVARLRLFTTDGQTLEFPIKAGVDSSEWAYDRPDIKAQIKHKRAPVAASYEVKDSTATFEGHTYVTKFSFPKQASIASGEVVIDPQASTLAPNLMLSLLRFSLGKGSDFYAVNQGAFSVSESQAKSSTNRWKLVGQTEEVDIYENSQALPRAWVTTEAKSLNENEMLQTIRTGKLPGGSSWDPVRTALLEPAQFGSQLVQGSVGPGTVTVNRYQANRIDLDVSNSSPGILVMSENHYPGWRAYVDDVNVEVMRVDYNLRGVMLSPGQHRVSFVYRPQSALIGLLVSLGTVGFLALWWRGIRQVSTTSR